MAASLPAIFRSVVSEIMARDASHTADWRLEEKNDKCELFIPKLLERGFDITVIADADEVTVYSEYVAHQHFSSYQGDHFELSQLAMGLVRDLLSPAMRVRVVKKGGKVVQGAFEICRDGEWQRKSTTALIGLPKFRTKDVEYYVNERLPKRDLTTRSL
jgi:hypothetical protein